MSYTFNKLSQDLTLLPNNMEIKCFNSDLPSFNFSAIVEYLVPSCFFDSLMLSDNYYYFIYLNFHYI